MTNIEKLLINLESTKANVRYEACEELRVAKAISKQANDALEKATNDPDPLVADAAQRALLIHNPPTPASQEIQELERSIGGTKTTDEIEIAKNPKDVAKLSYVVGVITGILYTFNNAGSGWQLDGGFLIFSFLFLFINVLYCLITCVPIGFLVGYVVHKTVNHHENRETLSILLGIGVGIIGGIVSGILTLRL